jgi:hypothetical protein
MGFVCSFNPNGFIPLFDSRNPNRSSKLFFTLYKSFLVLFKFHSPLITFRFFTQALLRFNNFNSILSIISGFGNSAVHRLKHTKAGMTKSLLAEMETMETLMSSKKSFATFRETLHAINPPCVPYLYVSISFYFVRSKKKK